MQVKTTLSYYLILARIAKSNKTNKKSGKVVGKGNPGSILVELPASSASMQSDTEIIKK